MSKNKYTPPGDCEIHQLIIENKVIYVSNDGRVFRNNWKELKKHTNIYGYQYVSFTVNGNRKKFRIHRLVAKAFLDNPFMLPEVNHKDGDKTNNNVTNLEWVTCSDNQLHSRYILLNQTGFKDTPIRCIETNKLYKSTREAWRDTGISYSHISECANGKRKSAGGYHWKSEVKAD